MISALDVLFFLPVYAVYPSDIFMILAARKEDSLLIFAPCSALLVLAYFSCSVSC
jgi:hypothetical protein